MKLEVCFGEKFNHTNLLASLYFSVPPYDGLEFIGAVANMRPSDVFHTGWALNSSVNILPELKLVV